MLSGTILITRFGIGPDVDFAAFGSPGGVSAPPDPNAPANKIRLDVHVTSAPQLDFQNSYAKLAGTVDLTIRGTVAVPSVLGRIEINEGSATFAGTKYQLQRGEIYFTNPVRIDPIIDLDATAQVENYDITVGLHGTATNLKPTYRSEPPLSEADVFALLALGRTQEEAQLYQERQVAAGHGSDDERAAGRRAECYGEQPGGEAVWRGKREDRSGVCGNAGAIVGDGSRCSSRSRSRLRRRLRRTSIRRRSS